MPNNRTIIIILRLRDCLQLRVYSVACVCVCADRVEEDTSHLSEHCTVCRHKLDINKPDSVFKHSTLSVLLCKVRRILPLFFSADLIVFP